MNIEGKLKLVTGPYPMIRVEVSSNVVWVGTLDEWSKAIARPDKDNDKPTDERLEKWMELTD